MMTALQSINEMEKNDKWLIASYENLKERYKNKFIAIKDGKVVAEAISIPEIMKSLEEKKINPSKTLIEFINGNRILIL